MNEHKHKRAIGNKPKATMEDYKQALEIIGIVLVDVEGGEMWHDVNNGRYAWNINDLLPSVDLSFLDNIS